MCSMCHHCGAELTRVKGEKRKQQNGNSLKLNNEGSSRSCIICGEKQEREYMKTEKSSPFSTPMISPTTSLSSSDRSFSSCRTRALSGEFSVEGNSNVRSEQEECATNQEEASLRPNGRLQNMRLEGTVYGLDKSYKTNGSNLKDGSNEDDNDVVREVEIMQPTNGQEAKHNDAEDISRSYKNVPEISQSTDGENEMVMEIWEPPEPEDPEDDVEGGLAYNDDDDADECGDDTEWGKPSSLSHFRDEGGRRNKFKEEKQKAMEEVLSGRFKAIVNQLLNSIGVVSSGKDGESWIEIVTSLSWEAASSLRPNFVDGKSLNSFVKIKCIATGSRNQSQIIKGLVFKKHAAHKHMPTKYNNPRLMLIRGVLGQSSSGLSSFKAMEQEKDQLKYVMDMIDTCHPNVVLVEKTVSRDIQESILAKGMTLVFDMKLHRLERVARCTGSPILSSDSLTSQELKHCDSFYIEKFVEEHTGFSEGGKRPSKTLMFIEGCPTRLGCTVLLKGSNSDELKRVKSVVQCAVVMAYHLILETSFLVDQRAMFSTIPFAELAKVLPVNHKYPASENGNRTAPHLEQSTVETDSRTTDIPVSNGFHEDSFGNNGLERDSVLSYEPYNPAIFSGFSSLSASLKKVIEGNLPLSSTAAYPSLTSYFGLWGSVKNGQITEEVPISKVMESSDTNEMEVKSSYDEEKPLDGRPRSLRACSENPLDVKDDCGNREDQLQNKEDANAPLNSQSILVLMSSRNALRGTICEQSHFSHIMFYKNFDDPLGKFLQNNLLNQKRQCSTCSELPEAHFYYYAHHNKQLTIRVKRLPDRLRLRGEGEGKIWMWSRCGKCKTENGVSKSTKRVVVSTAACGLSFGKFLELSFSHHSSSTRLSGCGHSLHRDFLYFFALGPMVGMFKYSPVMTYSVSVPPQKLEFSSSINKEWLREEFQSLYSKGILLFREVENSLKQMGSRFVGSTLNLRGLLKEFSITLEMLRQERAGFEVDIQKTVADNVNPDEALYKPLSLNRLRLELLLESCIWDRRLHSLLLPDPTVVIYGAAEKLVPQELNSKMDDTATKGDEVPEVYTEIDSNCCGKFMPKVSAEANEVIVKEILIDGLDKEESAEQEDNITRSTLLEGAETPYRMPNQDFTLRTNMSDTGEDNFQAEFPLNESSKVDKVVSNFVDLANNGSSVGPNASKNEDTSHSLLSDLEKLDGWFWLPFSELKQIYMKDIQRGFVPRFGCVSSYTPEHLPSVHQLISEEGARMHIPLGTDKYVVSDYEGELSSIIACALALLKEVPVSTVVSNEDSGRDNDGAVKTIDNLRSLTRIPTIASPIWSVNGFSDSDSIYSSLSISSEDLRFSSFDGLNLLESLITPEVLSPEVYIGVSKSLIKGKYSVKCLYANQFRDLRSRCCPSELDYIDSLSRCRNWDAKGGKSKSFFAKTLDDRFIIKEIKKTEFDSFDKFALHYFKYMNESFDLGNQTCLAKVLGIYQVTIRQPKSGKEMRHDLMVMENLTFGRKIIRQYDLKGALHARYSTAVDGSGDVLLDQNFVNDMNSSPLYVSNTAKRILQRAVWNDTTFLNSIDVMDYSLLVGVDSHRRELVCGIIDYLRQYTWDKHLETWVKASLAPKNVLPTVISPKEYKKRFRKFMSTHFLSVPDHWCSPESRNPCELCGIKDDDSSRSKYQKQNSQIGLHA